MIYLRELLSLIGLIEVSISGVEEKFIGWGMIWSMIFVGMLVDYLILIVKFDLLFFFVVFVYRLVVVFVF